MSAASGKFTITCLDWRPLQKNTRLGFARIRIAELRLIIHDVAVHEKAGSYWAQPPSKPWLKDGALVIGDDGKTKFSPIFEFDDSAVRSAFSRAVVNTVRTHRLRPAFPGEIEHWPQAIDHALLERCDHYFVLRQLGPGLRARLPSLWFKGATLSESEEFAHALFNFLTSQAGNLPEGTLFAGELLERLARRYQTRAVS